MYSTFQPFDHPDWRIWFYLIAQLLGGSALSLLLATMIWPTKKRKPRNPLLISLCFSWWISSFPCLCILYYAHQVTGPPPSYPVCLTSAVLTMGQSILVAATAPALLFNIWLIVKTAVGAKFQIDAWIARSTLFCIIVPYVLFITFVLASLAVGLKNPQLVHRALFYCVVDDPNLTLALGVVGTTAMVAAIVFQVWTVVLLYQNRSCIRQLTNEGHISLVVRVCIFGTYVFLGLCLNVISIVDWTNPVPDLFYSTFGLAVFLVFGTQRDIWRIWRDASRHLASPARSHCSAGSGGAHGSPLRVFAFRTGEAGPLSTSQQHLSLSRFDTSRQSRTASQAQAQWQTQSQAQWQWQTQSPTASYLQTQSQTPSQRHFSFSQFNYARTQTLPQVTKETENGGGGCGYGRGAGKGAARISLPLPAVLSRSSGDADADYFGLWRENAGMKGAMGGGGGGEMGVPVPVPMSVPRIVVQESTPDLSQATPDLPQATPERSRESLTPVLTTPTTPTAGESGLGLGLGFGEWRPSVPEKDGDYLRLAVGMRRFSVRGAGVGADGADSPVLGARECVDARGGADGGEGRADEEPNGGAEDEEEDAGGREAEASTVASRYSCSTWAHAGVAEDGGRMV